MLDLRVRNSKEFSLGIGVDFFLAAFARAPVRRIGIHDLSMRIVRHFKAAAFEARKTIERQIGPNRQAAGSAHVNSEIEDLLPRL